MGSVKDVLAGLPSASKRNGSSGDVMANPDYLRKSRHRHQNHRHSIWLGREKRQNGKSRRQRQKETRRRRRFVRINFQRL